ncbi:MAG: insulinase family protein [FCB group bacterium]|nr:insulinase family protein [FCB group bacterium]
MAGVCRVMMVALMASFIFASSAPAEDKLELKYEKFTLSNGLDVILHEDHSIPMVSVNIWYHVGSKNEKPGRTGFAHLFEHMMFQGSAAFDGEYFGPIQKIGGAVNGSTNNDRTNYWENVPSNYLELALAMESDRMGYLLDVMTQEKLDTQKDVVKNERRQGVDNQPYGIAYEMTNSLMYPYGHPYSWSVIGSMDDLSAASIEDVSEFFKLYYAPNNASLAIAGDFNPAEAKALVEKYFGPIPPGRPVQRMTGWIPDLGGVKRLVSEDNVELPRMFMLWHTPAFFAPGDAEFDLLGSILSSGKTSRLYKTLVYDLKIAQDIGVNQLSREMGSIFFLSVTAKPGHTLEEIEKIIDDELNKLLTEGITPEELTRAKISWEAGFIRGLQAVGGFGGRANRLNSYNVHLGSPDMLNWDRDRYTNATADSVMKYARQFIDLDNRGIVHIIPQGTLSEAESDLDRMAKPEPKAEPTFNPPAIETATLSNGLELMLVNDDRLPLIEMQLVIKRGWNADPTGAFGTASMTSDMLNEGTKTRTALQISQEARDLAAQIGTSSSYDATEVTLNVLKKHFDTGLNLAADILLNPTFPQEELDRLRQDYLARLQQEAKEPYPTAFKAFYSLLFGKDHPYSQSYTGSGTNETLEALTRDDLLKFYKDNYLPNLSTVVISGDITMSEAKKKLEKAFSGWKKGSTRDIALSTPDAAKETKIYIVDKPGAAQSIVVMGNLGIPRSDPDYMATRVLNQGLGGQFMSRINLNLREDKGYTYGARSNFSTRKAVGPFVAYAQVQSQFTKESVTEFVKELTDISGERPFTDEEISNSKASLMKSYPQGFQSLGNLAGKMNTMATYGLPVDSWKTYGDRVSGVSAGMVNAAIKKYIHPKALIIVVVGDRAMIEEGLKELNLGEVIVL